MHVMKQKRALRMKILYEVLSLSFSLLLLRNLHSMSQVRRLMSKNMVVYRFPFSLMATQINYRRAVNYHV